MINSLCFWSPKGPPFLSKGSPKGLFFNSKRVPFRGLFGVPQIIPFPAEYSTETVSVFLIYLVDCGVLARVGLVGVGGGGGDWEPGQEDCGTVQEYLHSTVQCSTVQYSRVQYSLSLSLFYYQAQLVYKSNIAKYYYDLQC